MFNTKVKTKQEQEEAEGYSSKWKIHEKMQNCCINEILFKWLNCPLKKKENKNPNRRTD